MAARGLDVQNVGHVIQYQVRERPLHHLVGGWKDRGRLVHVPPQISEEERNKTADCGVFSWLEMCSGSEEGSYLRPIDFCIAQL